MRSIFTFAGLALLVLLRPLPAQLPAALPPPPPAFEDEDFRVSVDVNLVLLHATVRDRSGHHVPDLTKDNFEVYEDGVRQSIRVFTNEDIPVTVGLVVDHSGSMRRKLADVSTAARTFAKARKPEDQIFVVNFNENVSLGLPASTPFTGNLDELESAILNAPAAGETALYDAVSLALDQLRSGAHAKHALVVISDGGDNASRLSLAELLKKAEESNALLYTIGIFSPDNPDRNPRVLRRLARATGGESYLPKALSDVVTTCERIAYDIRNQYTFGFVSSRQTLNSTYRRIQINAKAQGAGKLNVQTRIGYLSASESKPAGSEADK